MPRSSMWCEQRGSASLLFVVVILPLLLVFLAVGIEASHFFGVREEMLERLDSEMIGALRGAENDHIVSARLRERLRFLKPYLSVDEVRFTRSGRAVSGLVRGWYRGPLLEVAAQLTGGTVDGVHMAVASTARRSHSAALLILDRTLAEGAEPCGDPNLRTRGEAIGEVAERLRGDGVSVIRVGVLPGVRGEVDIMDDGDTVLRCSGADSSTLYPGEVRGSPKSDLPDPLAIATRVVEAAWTLDGEPPIERRSIIMLSPSSPQSDEYISTVFALVESEATRRRASVQAIGIVVAESEDEESLAARSESGRASYLRVSPVELRGASLRTALLHHTQGRAMIAR